MQNLHPRPPSVEDQSDNVKGLGDHGYRNWLIQMFQIRTVKYEDTEKSDDYQDQDYEEQFEDGEASAGCCWICKGCVRNVCVSLPLGKGEHDEIFNSIMSVM